MLTIGERLNNTIIAGEHRYTELTREQFEEMKYFELEEKYGENEDIRNMLIKTIESRIMIQKMDMTIEEKEEKWLKDIDEIVNEESIEKFSENEKEYIKYAVIYIKNQRSFIKK